MFARGSEYFSSQVLGKHCVNLKVKVESTVIVGIRIEKYVRIRWSKVYSW